jgi:hypothetical protein
MRESRTYGFVRGVLGDRYPYRDSQPLSGELSLPNSSRALAGTLAQSPNLAAFATMFASPPAGVSAWHRLAKPRYRPNWLYVSVSRFWHPL